MSLSGLNIGINFDSIILFDDVIIVIFNDFFMVEIVFFLVDLENN